MRYLRRFIIFLFIIVSLGFGSYYFMLNYISTKAAQLVNEQLEDEKVVNYIKGIEEQYPEVEQFLEEGAMVHEDDLLFSTKEEAIDTIVQTIGMKEMLHLQTTYKNGISEGEIARLLKRYEHKFTDEEILAFKAIAYKELYK